MSRQNTNPIQETTEDMMMTNGCDTGRVGVDYLMQNEGTYNSNLRPFSTHTSKHRKPKEIVSKEQLNDQAIFGRTEQFLSPINRRYNSTTGGSMNLLGVPVVNQSQFG